MTKPIVPPIEALRRLVAGNERYANDTRSIQALASHLSRNALLAGQSPFAIILACSDSRAPAEVVFDQGVGDLFVIRVAGNVVAPSIIGSAEYAAATFGTRLLVVMGHKACGAVRATIDALRGENHISSDNVRDIVERIRPTAQTVLEAGAGRPYEELVAEAVRANVRTSVDHLRHGGRILSELVRTGQLVIVGAVYDIGTGRVKFIDLPDELREALSTPAPAPALADE
jgi:carbonic anhydrase